MSDSRQFEYLLNAMENAAHQANPSQHNYHAKRKAVLDYVAKLERLTSPEDVLALARAVIENFAETDYNAASSGNCWFCGETWRRTVNNIKHTTDCPVPIAQRVIAERGEG